MQEKLTVIDEELLFLTRDPYAVNEAYLKEAEAELREKSSACLRRAESGIDVPLQWLSYYSDSFLAGAILLAVLSVILFFVSGWEVAVILLGAAGFALAVALIYLFVGRKRKNNFLAAIERGTLYPAVTELCNDGKCRTLEYGFFADGREIKRRIDISGKACDGLAKKLVIAVAYDPQTKTALPVRLLSNKTEERSEEEELHSLS